jgi:hypothetical protein
MIPELEKKLIEKYPKLYNQQHFWGFDCGDGWYNLIDHLSGAIDAYTNPVSEFNVFNVVVSQVKEKFGALRFYADNTDRVVDGMIWLAEHMSAHTCETCGNPGELRDGSWLVTLCDLHHDERTTKEV